ncbi:hypothetical protein [Microbulbifer hainanensis]|uniref:hypothetical protein n=1 Tax=Microbulbifer hainanensis TaxID=2735675 RepID=UPI00186827C2|nr:hypothetical protein [Microbulbifer hainanensis]
MSVWEHQYRDAVAEITSPGTLDEKILLQARQFKPVKQENRWLSKAAGSCAAVAVIVLLVHPAQYLGALTPKQRGAQSNESSSLTNWQLQKPLPATGTDPWFELRSEVQAGNYMRLCQQWRHEQRGITADKLPRDLANKARKHCRLLPTH